MFLHASFIHSDKLLIVGIVTFRFTVTLLSLLTNIRFLCEQKIYKITFFQISCLLQYTDSKIGT